MSLIKFIQGYYDFLFVKKTHFEVKELHIYEKGVVFFFHLTFVYEHNMESKVWRSWHYKKM